MQNAVKLESIKWNRIYKQQKLTSLEQKPWPPLGWVYSQNAFTIKTKPCFQQPEIQSEHVRVNCESAMRFTCYIILQSILGWGFVRHVEGDLEWNGFQTGSNEPQQQNRQPANPQNQAHKMPSQSSNTPQVTLYKTKTYPPSKVENEHFCKIAFPYRSKTLRSVGLNSLFHVILIVNLGPHWAV